MGVREISSADGGAGDRLAMQRVLRDLEAMERMLEAGLFETSPMRLGAEQELVLVDRAFQPAPVGPDVLEQIDDPRVVPEISRFNLEFNCDPIELGGAGLRTLEGQLHELYTVITEAAGRLGVRPLLAGICPTVDLAHLRGSNIAPPARYAALESALRRMRGGDYELRIDGADELTVRHPSVMLESANTSFQVHLQTTPEDFASAYNVSLAVAAPVLAAAVNSPILFGKRLWRETRIAIFQQVVDTRGHGAGHRDFLGRVRFGEDWVRSSVLEIVRADVTRFRQILRAAGEAPPDPLEELDAGRVPRLPALQTFNSTVYRWMRPCYGITNGRPHLRIENRVLPAGPTIADEVANAAFWVGLMIEGPHLWPDLTQRLDFRDARSNFLRAARDGLTASISWLDDEELQMCELLSERLIPAARAGLERAGFDASDISRCLGTIERRVESRATGSHWTLNSIARMRGEGTRAQRLAALTRAMLRHQEAGSPVHTWPEATLAEEDAGTRAFSCVAQCMTTDLFTVDEEECLDLIASMMDWNGLRHIPVEDSERRLIGLVSYRALLRTLTHASSRDRASTMAARDIMVRDPVTVSPDTGTLEAIRMMCEHRVSCLPVVEEGRLVGMLSDRDYTAIARELLERALREDAGA